MVSSCQTLLTAALVLVFAAPVASNTITPVQSVLGMLSDMKAKGEKMLEQEEKTYAAYAEWVDDEDRELGFQIKTAESDISKLIAFIDSADSKVKELGDAIAALDAEIATDEKSKADATALRNEQNAEFLVLEKDYSESVDALERAIQVLGAQDYSRPQAMMLLQKMATTTPGMKRALAAFLSEGRANDDGAPAVSAYKFQSQGIIEVLEGLEKKFKGELDDLQTDESNKAHYYGLEQIHLADMIAHNTADREEKSALKAATAADSAKAKGDLAETKEEKAADEKQLADMKATFEAKTATYKENQVVRKDEIEALTKAIEIISSPEVAGSYAGHINEALVQASPKALSLLQVGATQRRQAAQQKMVEFLQKKAGALSSKTLARFALEAAANPFAKVIDMIKELLERLKAEAAAEAEHKAWCDEQLHNNKLKRNKQTAMVNKLIAEIEEKSSLIADLGQEIDTLVQEQADLAKAMAEATAFREKEHAENTATIADSVAGQEAVKKALGILREFYSSQTAFLQRQVPEMAAYKGMQTSKGGPIGMLEVILTDFARLQSETEAAEAAAAREYATFMEDSEASKVEKHKKEVADRLAKDATEFDKSELKKDLAANEAELATANQYYDTLKPLCLQVHVSYEERVAKRKEELAALNEAYEILDQK